MNALPVIDMVATGQNIAALRESAGYSVRKLQAVMGFSTPQAIYKWQRGQSMPSIDNLAALAAVLALCLREETSGKTVRFSKTLLRVGRDASCDLVFDQKEDKKKIDKVHAVFELRQGVWHVMDQSRSGVWINGNRIAANTPTAVHPGDRVELGQRRTLRID